MTSDLSRRADLHLHTTYSDGTSSPEELVEQAVQAGLKAMAVTDHDCLEAVPFAMKAAAGRIEVISGIEMTASFRDTELHVLGFFLDAASSKALEHLEKLKSFRGERLKQMIERLRRYDVHVTLEEVLEFSGHGTPGRPHLARILADRGYVKTPEEAFQRFLGDQAPCFVKGAAMTVAQAAAFIREAGGVSTLAHPLKFVPDEWLPELIAAGVQGIEVYHPDHSSSAAKRYLNYVEGHHLLASGGSDFHGSWKTEGPAVGAVTVPYAWVERLKKQR
ncbi:MAG: PHP domain-containing protein [Candidatus Omnitrophica bacterium]|nr:PHP domain-containing protein [Candidatus Omnitrophota bacterium]